jgi:hypothetical protein
VRVVVKYKGLGTVEEFSDIDAVDVKKRFVVLSRIPFAHITILIKTMYWWKVESDAQ